MTARFLVGDVHERLADLEDDSVDLVFSSPPFLALRSYLPADHPDKAREIGSEASPAEFLDALLDVVEACGRVLAPHGSLCFELGDTYAGGGQGPDAKHAGSERPTSASHGPGWPEAKSLTGIPTLFAWSLAYGRNLLRPERELERWRIRNLVPWCRPNPPVGALGDKWRPATSFVTVACRSRSRWFDLDAVRTDHRRDPASISLRHGADDDTERRHNHGRDEFANSGNPAGAPPLDYMVLPTQPYKGSHYATFPERLPQPFIESMCPREVCRECGEPRRRIVERTERYAAARAAVGDMNERRKQGIGDGKVMHGVSRSRVLGTMTAAEHETLGWTDCGHDDYRRGVVLDPFAGSGTTLKVAVELGRDAVGIDLDARNLDLARERCGMFLEAE